MPQPPHALFVLQRWGGLLYLLRSSKNESAFMPDKSAAFIHAPGNNAVFIHAWATMQHSLLLFPVALGLGLVLELGLGLDSFMLGRECSIHLCLGNYAALIYSWATVQHSLLPRQK